ncbi:MAG: helix-hairpin-helix domain-containing protein [Salibacteraceae bacterium]
MAKHYKYIVVFSLILIPFFGIGQDKELRNDIIQQRIEFIAQQYESSSIDFSNLIEVLTYYFDHPLNLNSATEEELESLNLLSPFQVRNFINYRIKKGELLTIYELRGIDGFDLMTIQNIVPFIDAKPKSKQDNFNLKKSLQFGNHEIMALWGQVMEEQQGYTEPDSNSSENSRYLGDPNRLYFRYRFKYANKLSFGLTAEKDPGEEFFKGSNTNGFDYYSAHLYAANIGIVKQLAVGDFHAQFGQGLTFWSGFSYRKTADALNVVRYGRKLSPYASRNENNFLRGAGTTIQIKDFELTAFYSNKGIDANLADRDTLNAEDRTFTSFQESGLHRTPGEIADKKAVNEQIIGANLGWSKNAIKLGSRIIHSKYGTQFDGNKQLYQKYQLDTNQWYNAGLDANILLKNINLFGEASMSSNGGWAYLAGALLKLDDRFSLSIINRNFQPDYLSVYANSFGERSENNNEKGLYVGAKADIANGVVLTGYVDKYQFDWLSFRADGPLEGLDYMLRLQWQINRSLSVYSRYRTETQTNNANIDQTINSLTETSRSYLRFHLTYSASSQFKINSRVEFSKSNYPGAENGTGFVVYQDFQYKFMDYKSTLTGRLAIFDIDDYNARIYAYENDVLYYFSVPAFYKRGTRGFLVYHYKPNRKIEFWAKVSRTFLSHENTFGSGTELIQVPQKTEVRVQVRYKF